MNRLRYIIRVGLLLLFILQLVSLYKTDSTFKAVIRFKYETLKKANDDSLETRQKFDSLVNKTKDFNHEVVAKSSYFKKGVGNLVTIAALLIVAEVGFAIVKRTRSTL